MKISEFFDEVYLHDSLIESMDLDGSDLTFHITLLWWMQEAFRPDDNETKNLKVVFKNISRFNFEGESKRFNSDTILEASARDDETGGDYKLVKMALLDDSVVDDNFKLISFKAADVEYIMSDS